jgi:hypothetical protein
LKGGFNFPWIAVNFSFLKLAMLAKLLVSSLTVLVLDCYSSYGVVYNLEQQILRLLVILPKLLVKMACVQKFVDIHALL